jgi:allantoicase
VLGAAIDDPLDLRALDSATWIEIAAGKLAGDTKNRFEVTSERRFTHVRLEIFPDGGVARLRVHGEAVVVLPPGLVDLAALEHGAVVESCSDMFFGSRNNLIKPGPSLSMADGWETRRRRGPGNDWALIRLAHAGTIDRLEIDTSHFKGNAPAHCTVEGTPPVERGSSAEIRTTEDWRLLLATPLQPHTRHVFDDLRRVGPVTQLRLSVFPCGGVARLRAWGWAPGVPVDVDEEALLRCCGARRWAKVMAAASPFEDLAMLLRIAETTWWAMSDSDRLEAFAAHPKIGDKGPRPGDKWSAQEQSGTASAQEQTLAALADANRTYFDQYGFIYIVCATGRSADAMLADIRARLRNTRADEMRTASEEQAKILRLRLTKLVQERT